MNINKIISLMPEMAVFVTVVETGNFTEAGKKLGITPSAVSRKISHLESALAVTLLERTTRKIALSESSKVIYKTCQQMLESAKEAVQVSSSSHITPAGTLRIAMPKAYAKQVFEPLIFPFLKRYPDIKLKVKVTDQFINPIHDEIDIIFRISNQPTEGLVARKVGKVEQILCASPNYLKQHGTPQHPSDLSKHQCLFLGETPLDDQWHFKKGNEKVTVDVQGRYIVNHSEMRLNGVIHDLGVGLLPDFTVKTAITSGHVIRVLSDWSMETNYQGLISLQFAQSKFMPSRSRVFIDYVLDTLK